MHEITVYDERARAVYGRNIPAWHKLGGLEPGLMDSETVAQRVQAPIIHTRQTFFCQSDLNPHGDPFDNEDIKKAGDFRLTVAKWEDGTEIPLGQVTKRWKTVQFADAFKIFDPVVREIGACYDAAGVLEGGKVFWCLVKLNSDLLVGKADNHEQFLLFTTRNDGTGSVIVKATTIRVVCANTNAVALGQKTSELKIRHSGDVESKIEDAASKVELAIEALKNSETTFNEMLDTKIETEDRAQLIADVLGIDLTKDLSTRSENNLAKVARALSDERHKSPEAEGTVYETYNAVTRYVDHMQTVRATNGERDAAKLRSLGFGTGAKRKEAAFALCAAKCGLSDIEIPDVLPPDIG